MIFLFIVRVKLFDRLKAVWSKLVTLSRTGLVNLNLFALRDFQNGVNQITAKRLGRLATRLYMTLVITGLVILVIYTAIRPRILVKTLDRPSFDIYKRLIRDHSDTLECSCSSISSTYDRYVKIEPVFHQVKPLILH